jgi:hypothetical protein
MTDPTLFGSGVRLGVGLMSLRGPDVIICELKCGCKNVNGMRTVVSQSAQWLMTARTHCLLGGFKVLFEFPKCSNFKPDCTWCYTGSTVQKWKSGL